MSRFQKMGMTRLINKKNVTQIALACMIYYRIIIVAFDRLIDILTCQRTLLMTSLRMHLRKS